MRAFLDGPELPLPPLLELIIPKLKPSLLNTLNNYGLVFFWRVLYIRSCQRVSFEAHSLPFGEGGTQDMGIRVIGNPLTISNPDRWVPYIELDTLQRSRKKLSIRPAPPAQ